MSLARQQGRNTGNIKHIALPTCLSNVLVDFLTLAQQKDIDLGVLRLDEISVLATAQDIETLLRNAISNAIRYTPIGRKVDIRIYAETINNEKWAVIEITDSGSGIPEAEMTRVFDPFYRVLGQAATRNGLGLTIIQEIAKRYGGQIRLSNLENPHGFCFVFRMQMV